MSENLICISGGARGADTFWGATTVKNGGDEVHYSFEGHNASAPEASLIRLPPELLLMGHGPLVRAAETLKRGKKAVTPYVMNLLLRNWWQVESPKITALYCVVGRVEGGGTVSGGTAYAVQMYLDRLRDSEKNFDAYPIFAFDQTVGNWYQRCNEKLGAPPWLILPKPPTPIGRFTGVGTRHLNKFGRAAILGLWESND